MEQNRIVSKTVLLLLSSLTAAILLFAACSGPKASFTDYTVIDTTYPVQEKISNPEAIIITKGKDTFTIHPQARYRVGAVVRSKRRYRTDAVAKISPYDFALVWGFLADEFFYRQVRISQGGRRYFFRPKRDSNISIDWIYLNSSNNHLIPANDNIRRALRRVRRNDTIEIEGYLVFVHANAKGRTFSWNSSLTREDKGDGSCEIIYVKRIKINYRVYE